MSIFVIQVIIKQWDKSQRTPSHVEERAKIPEHYPILFPPASYLFNEQCVIDQHGDDLLGNRIRCLQPSDDIIQFDRFQISLSNKQLDYMSKASSESAARTLGSVDNAWIQCNYNWRYGVDEGGFYYWLYEQLIVNVMCVESITETLFMDSKPAIVVDLD